MTAVLAFAITFHSPYFAATGRATAGFDATVDLDAPVRETAIKGAMRAVARDTLGIHDNVVREIFGSPDTASAWCWVMSPITSAALPLTRHRIQIDDATHAAAGDHLQRTLVAVLPVVPFEIRRREPADEATLRRERLVLTASAHGVHALGGQRTRGLGWVGIQGGDPIDEAAVSLLREWRS